MAIIDNERAANLYKSNEYARNTRNWEDSAAIFRAEAFYKVMSKADIITKVKSILDVGCGSGGVLIQLSKRFGKDIGDGNTKYFGIDLSPNAIDIAKNLYPDSDKYNVSFSVELIDIENTSKYSVISLIHVLEHCPDMLEMLSICEKKAYYLYINVPIEINIFYTIRRDVLMNQYINYGHLHFFNERFFLSWLQKNKFEVLSYEYSTDFEVNKAGIIYKIIQYIRRWIGIRTNPSFATWLLGGYSFGVLVRSRARCNRI